MENVHPQQAPQPPPRRQRSSPKMERRIIEKKRRDHMKGLYSSLFSLLPSYKSKGILPVPDQIDEAVEYIKNLQLKIEKMNQKKEKFLLSENKRRGSCVTETSSSSRLVPPKYEIHEMGPAMDVVLLTGLDKPTTFYKILRSLHEDGFEVVHANFSSSGNSMLQVAYAKMGKSVARRLKELFQEHDRETTGDPDLESSLDICEFDVESDDKWGSEFLDVMPELELGELTSILNTV